MAKTYYDILGIPDAASDEEIRRAYRRVMREYHPDLNPDKAKSARRTRELNSALDALTSPEKRKKYDKKLERRRRRASKAEARKESKTSQRQSESKASGHRGPESPQNDSTRRGNNSDRRSRSGATNDGQRNRHQTGRQRTDTGTNAGFRQTDGGSARPGSRSTLHPDNKTSRHSYNSNAPFGRAPDPSAGDDFGYSLEDIAPVAPKRRYSRTSSMSSDRNTARRYFIWLGLGIGIGSLIILIVLTINKIYPIDVIKSFRSKVGVDRGRSPAGPLDRNRAERDSREAPSTPSRARPFTLRLMKTENLFAQCKVRMENDEPDFDKANGGYISRETGRRVLDLPNSRVTSECELVVEVTRLSGNGPLILGMSNLGRKFSIKIDGSSPGGYYSGVQRLHQGSPSRDFGGTIRSGPLLSIGKTITVSCLVSRYDPMITVKVDNRTIDSLSFRTTRIALDREIADITEGVCFVVTDSASFRVSRLELRQYAPARSVRQ